MIARIKAEKDVDYIIVNANATSWERVLSSSPSWTTPKTPPSAISRHRSRWRQRIPVPRGGRRHLLQDGPETRRLS